MRSLLLFSVTAVAFRVYDEESHQAPVPEPERQPVSLYFWYLDENEERQKSMLEANWACYCKKVSSMKYCSDHSRSKSASDIDYERFFHSAVDPGSEKPHLCCKLASVYRFDWKGFGYNKQATPKLCFGETRPLEDACCRIRKEEQVAVRVKQIKTKAGKQVFRRYTPSGREYWEYYYKKSLPYFSINDIASAMDSDGSPLSVQQVEQLLQNKTGASGDSDQEEEGEKVYACSKPLDELMADQEDCHVR
eukprot:Skav213234  [mRNA]  locus=scaffold1151:73331:74616:+ [translate_table: standard]